MNINALAPYGALRGDDVILHWARTMTAYFNCEIHFPRFVLDEMIMLLCAHLTQEYQDPSKSPEIDIGD
jgi:hypothetical protein